VPKTAGALTLPVAMTGERALELGRLGTDAETLALGWLDTDVGTLALGELRAGLSLLPLPCGCVCESVRIGWRQAVASAAKSASRSMPAPHSCNFDGRLLTARFAPGVPVPRTSDGA
jgi:hypothetical protein